MTTIFDKIFAWIFSASYDQTSVTDWLAGVMLIFILAFLWSTVVNHTIEEV
jgi:hypothetical protein